jgi:glyoxylase I family protein
MPELELHHASIPVRDLEKSAGFYEKLFGFQRLQRPPFDIPGVWFGCGGRQIHLVVNARGSYRTNAAIEIADTHFALRTDDFDGMVERLKANGFDENAGECDPKRLLVLRGGLAGFDQLYLLDPDFNLIEVNNAPL